MNLIITSERGTRTLDTELMKLQSYQLLYLAIKSSYIFDVMCSTLPRLNLLSWDARLHRPYWRVRGKLLHYLSNNYVGDLIYSVLLSRLFNLYVGTIYCIFPISIKLFTSSGSYIDWWINFVAENRLELLTFRLWAYWATNCSTPRYF